MGNQVRKKERESEIDRSQIDVNCQYSRLLKVGWHLILLIIFLSHTQRNLQLPPFFADYCTLPLSVCSIYASSSSSKRKSIHHHMRFTCEQQSSKKISLCLYYERLLNQSAYNALFSRFISNSAGNNNRCVFFVLPKHFPHLKQLSLLNNRFCL